MSQQVCSGAVLQCSFGLAPSSLNVLPVRRVLTSQQPAATIMDYQPMINIAPFGMCACPANPSVVTATAAAQGVLTPMPCMPMTMAPWTPGCATVLLGQVPALDGQCQLACLWGGVITVAMPGQFTHDIP